MEWIVFKFNQSPPQSEIAFNNLSKKNQEIITKWCDEKSILSKSVKRRENRRRTITKFLTFINKDYDEFDYDDYVQVASAISGNKKVGIKSKNGDKDFIKRFIKDNYNNWNKTFKGLELLKAEIEGDDKKLSPKDLLTELEIDKLMRATPSLQDKTMICVLSACGCRPEELLKLIWSDIDFEKRLIYFYSIKTKKKRAVPMDSIISHLIRLKEETTPKDNDLIFPSVSGKIMSNAGLNFKIHQLSKKAGIKKRVWGNLFRHTRLSYLITKLSPKVYEEVSGHSLAMGMKTYAHLSQDKIIKEMREKVFEIKDLPEEKKHELEKKLEEHKESIRDLYKLVKSLKKAQGESLTIKETAMTS